MVGYDAGTARFVGQIEVSDGSFSDGGDFGSLIVTNDGNNNPVALLFAGGSSSTFGNPIDVVLTALGVTIDDGTPQPEPTPTPIPGPTAMPTLPPPTPTPTATPVPGDITFDAAGYKVRGRQKADLTWSGANSTNVDIVLDGQVIATTSNDGLYTDNIDNQGGGSYVYEVCEEGTVACSNQSTVTFGL